MAMAAIPLLTAAGASAGTAATVGSLLSIGTAAAGAMSAIKAGNTQSAMYKSQAQQTELNAKLENIKGRQEAQTMRQQRDANLASINATFSARGGYAGSGTPAQAIIESRKNAGEAIDTAMFNSNMRGLQQKAQAQTLRVESRTARQGGYINAFTGLAKNKEIGPAISTLLSL